MTVKQNVTKRNRANKREAKWTKKWCVGVTFVYLNKLSFMRNWWSRIEKQSHEQTFKQSADDTKSQFIVRNLRNYVIHFMYKDSYPSVLSSNVVNL